jgi:hypothetical protein
LDSKRLAPDSANQDGQLTRIEGLGPFDQVRQKRMAEFGFPSRLRERTGDNLAESCRTPFSIDHREG